MDFGEVWEGAVLSHEFRFEVRGSEPLRVEAVSADCGCTAAELQELRGDERFAYVEGQPLEPGTELVLGVTYDTHGKAGTGQRLVKLFCNEADGVSLVTVQAEVKRRFRTEPDPPPSVQMAMGDGKAIDFEVLGVADEPFVLRHLSRGLPPSVEVSLSPIDPDDEGRSVRWKVDVACGPDTPRGTHSYPIFLEAPDWIIGTGDNAEAQSFAPFVTVQVKGRFSTTPQTVNFGAVGTEETVSRTVRLTCNDPGFDLTAPRVEIEQLAEQWNLAWAERAKVEVRPVPGERAFDIELVLQGLSPETERRFLGKLTIETSHPLEPRMVVNVSGFRSDGGPR